MTARGRGAGHTGAVTAAPATVDARALADRLRSAYDAGLTRPLPWRRTQLRGLDRLLVDGERELLAALRSDFGKPDLEAWLTELAHVRHELAHIQSHLAAWARPERVPLRAVLRPGSATTVAEPLGVALVLAPWNYPVHLLLLPMAYAVAAGNAVVGKPSELAPATSATLARLLPRYLDERTTALVEGDAAVATTLLEERWDHVFYTGNGRIGRVVMAAAARHLTPVTLELGGKSPAIVERSADLAVAARRIVWGKFVNAGQTCVAPDYVLVDEPVAEALLAKLAEAVRSLYGDDPAASPDLARIVDDRHVERLAGLLAGVGPDRLVTGGRVDRATRYVAPTVVRTAGGDDPLMHDELFGPILPVITVRDVGAAIAAVRARDKPLALYVFTEDTGVAERVVAETSSGGVCVNGTLVHLAVTDLPFGGVGASGIGAYHGRAGFETFSHRKGVLVRRSHPDPGLMYPPYGRAARWVLRRLG